MHLMELLDTLLVYRVEHDKPNASQSVVKVCGSDLAIEWLPLGYMSSTYAINLDKLLSESQCVSFPNQMEMART